MQRHASGCARPCGRAAKRVRAATDKRRREASTARDPRENHPNNAARTWRKSTGGWAFDAAPEGAELVAPRLARSHGQNLRTTFTKIITRAGLKPWPRLFHALRSSCETDWCDRFPAHVVASWVGHSPLIAARHYLQTRDAHFQAAAAGGEALRNALQRTHADGRERAHDETENVGDSRGIARINASASVSRSERMGVTGLEPLAGDASVSARGRNDLRPGRPNPTDERAARGATIGDPELAEVLRAWPNLPAETRERVLALIHAPERG